MVRPGRAVWAVMMAAVFAAMAVLGPAAWAADPPQKIGIIDVQKVLSDAPRMKQYMEEYEVLRKQLGQSLEIRQQNLMLDENQIKELVDLKAKQNATDKDKARIKELEDIERTRDADFKQLQGTQNPTDVQKTKLRELQDMRQKSTTTGEALEKDYNSRLQTKMQELSEKANADMQEAINKVVEAKSLNLVLVKDAVRFGGTDITDDVMNKLERKVQ